MNLKIAAAVAVLSAAACTKKAPPDAEGAPSPSYAPETVEAAVPPAPVSLVAPRTTDGSIALSNLDSQIRARQAIVERRPDDVDAANTLVLFLLARGQYRGSVADYEHADALAVALVERHPESGDAHLTHAATLGTFHLFARVLDEAAAAEKAGAAGPEVGHARATALMGQGRFDEADATGVWRDTSHLDSSDLASAAVLAGERGLDAESDRLFDRARVEYRDVSPFPVAWADFQRGWLLERHGDRARARLYLAEAHAVLPLFPHAAVHLAGLETPDRARVLLEPLLGKSDDPEVDVAYADALRRLGRIEDAKPFVDRARARYDVLLKTHLEAFADHASAFYLGMGHDPARALELARANAENRGTEAAIDALMVAALAAGAREEACAAAARGALLRYATPAFRETVRTARVGCPDTSPSRSPSP